VRVTHRVGVPELRALIAERWGYFDPSAIVREGMTMSRSDFWKMVRKELAFGGWNKAELEDQLEGANDEERRAFLRAADQLILKQVPKLRRDLVGERLR
jgi:hypothetical protein